MDLRKKACPNENCKTYKRQKFNFKINYCPECGSKLIYVCKSHKCFKPLDDSNHSDYCRECETKRSDRHDKVVDGVKKAGVVVAIPFVKAVQKDAGKIAQKAGHVAVNAAIKFVKK